MSGQRTRKAPIKFGKYNSDAAPLEEAIFEIAVPVDVLIGELLKYLEFFDIICLSLTCRSLRQKALLFFRTLPSVFTPYLSNDFLVFCTNLQALTVSGESSISGWGLRRLSLLTSLVILNEPLQIDNSDLEHLTGLKTLRITNAEQPDASVLLFLTNLTRLHLDRITYFAELYLLGIPTLRHLSLGHQTLSEEVLVKLTQLESLALVDPQRFAPGVLTSLVNLNALSLSLVDLSTLSVQIASRMAPHLKRLDLGNSVLNLDCIVAFTGLLDLTLSMKSGRLGRPILLSFTNLTRLAIISPEATRSDVPWQELSCLRSIAMDGNTTHTGVEFPPKLTALSLARDTAVQDRAVRRFLSLTELSLIGHTRITEKAFQRLPTLRYLDISENYKISESALITLTSLKVLRHAGIGLHPGVRALLATRVRLIGEYADAEGEPMIHD